jgi:hypothetical protein
MEKSDPFGFDMSVKSAKKKNPRGRRGMSGATETSTRLCEHEGCQEAGKYRAPKAPDVLDEFRWFCKDHVREYNLKWNFFDGSPEEAVEEQHQKDRVWERETKPFKKSAEERAWSRLGVDDPHQVLGENATQNPGKSITGTRKLPHRAARDRHSRSQGPLDQGRGAQGLQIADQGAAPRHERRRPFAGGTAPGSGLGLGSDQGQPQLQVSGGPRALRHGRAA